MDQLGCCSAPPDSGGHHPGWHVGQDDRIGADPRAVTDDDRTQNFGASSDPDPVADARLTRAGTGVAEGDALIDDEVLAGYYFVADNDSYGMDDRQSWTQPRGGVDLCAGGTDARCLEPKGQWAEPLVPAPRGGTVGHHCADAWIQREADEGADQHAGRGLAPCSRHVTQVFDERGHRS